jgi:hypothetical protein
MDGKETCTGKIGIKTGMDPNMLVFFPLFLSHFIPYMNGKNWDKNRHVFIPNILVFFPLFFPIVSFPFYPLHACFFPNVSPPSSKKQKLFSVEDNNIIRQLLFILEAFKKMGERNKYVSFPDLSLV